MSSSEEEEDDDFSEAEEEEVKPKAKVREVKPRLAAAGEHGAAPLARAQGALLPAVGLKEVFQRLFLGLPICRSP